MTAYVGIGLHRRRSVAVCLNGRGDRLWWRRIENSPETLAEVVAEAGPFPEVVIEATWCWYWAAPGGVRFGHGQAASSDYRHDPTWWRVDVGD
jgi:hypothetical protein